MIDQTFYLSFFYASTIFRSQIKATHVIIEQKAELITSRMLTELSCSFQRLWQNRQSFLFQRIGRLARLARLARHCQTVHSFRTETFQEPECGFDKNISGFQNLSTL